MFADWAALNVAGFEPSISRELNVVDAGFGAMLGETLTTSAFLVLGVAFVDRSVRPLPRQPDRLDASSCPIAAGVFAATDQETILPALVLVAGMCTGDG